MAIIAVDAMGGDYAPRVAVAAAVRAARTGIHVRLFGDQHIIIDELTLCDVQWRSYPISLVNCTERIEMGEEPSWSVVRKKDASIVRAMNELAEGLVDAFVSAGNSGAVHVAASLIVGRVKGVMRPALGGFLPTIRGKVLCLDLGANTDCKAEYLEQFAHMGHAYLTIFKDVNSPKIALVANGHEPYKGSAAVRAAYRLLEKSQKLHFIGNVEARDTFETDADVLVCDGFVGNILLKTAQGTFRAIMRWLQQEARESWYAKISLFAASPVFKRIKNRLDYAKTGGVLLLGVDKPVVVAHGSSREDALENAILFANRTALDQRFSRFNTLLASLLSVPLSKVRTCEQ